MPRHTVDTSSWNRTNLLPGSEPGTLVSRGALVSLSVGSAFSSYAPGGVYSIRPQQDDIMRNYFVGVRAGTSLTQIVGNVSDNPPLNQEFCEKTVMNSGAARVVSWAKVDQYLFCCSPDFATHFGIPGAGMFEASEEDVLAADGSTVYEALPIPRGICVEWAGRLVIAADDVVYFADTGTPFTFLSFNALDPPGGSVRGLHSVNGTLVICTTQGTWALPAEAGMRENVFGQWQKVSDYRCLEYAQTVDFQGVVWGVSERGIQAVYPGGAEVDVNQAEGQRWHGERLRARNWRSVSTLIRFGNLGVGLVDTNRSAMYLFQPQYSAGSWMRSDPPAGDWFSTVGVFYLDSGEHVMVTASGRSLLMLGNRDDFETVVNASVSGSTREHNVDRSPVMRKVEAAADCAGDGNIFLAVKGKALKTKEPPARGVICGTSTWGDNTKLEELEVRSRDLHTSYRSDDHEIEVGVTEGGKTLRADMVVHFHGIGRYRPTN